MAGLKFECNCKDIRRWILHTLSTVFIVTSLTTKFTFDFSDINHINHHQFIQSDIFVKFYYHCCIPSEPSEAWTLDFDHPNTTSSPVKPCDYVCQIQNSFNTPFFSWKSAGQSSQKPNTPITGCCQHRSMIRWVEQGHVGFVVKPQQMWSHILNLSFEICQTFKW